VRDCEDRVPTSCPRDLIAIKNVPEKSSEGSQAKASDDLVPSSGRGASLPLRRE